MKRQECIYFYIHYPPWSCYFYLLILVSLTIIREWIWSDAGFSLGAPRALPEEAVMYPSPEIFTFILDLMFWGSVRDREELIRNNEYGCGKYDMDWPVNMLLYDIIYWLG